MPPQNAGGGQQPDNSLGPLWIIIGIFVAALILWYTAHTYITEAILAIRLGEIAVMSLFTNSLEAVHQQILATNPASVNFEFLATISTTVGQKIAIPLAILLCALAAVLYKLNAKNRYRKIYSMQSLKTQEQENWPQITPVVNLDLVNTHIHEGPWAMSDTPMQFAKRHKLLTQETVADVTGLASREYIAVKVVDAKATQIFIQQLGRPWRGLDKLPIHTKALFAIFAAKANADRESATRLLFQIATSAGSSGKLNFSGVDEVLKKHASTKIIKKVMTSHAYELTLMASLLEVARLDGVLASAEFLWLKPIDRPLWYMLNNVGRRTAFTEVAGPFAHWLAEKLIGRKLLIPMVQEATIGLKEAIAEVLYNPDQDY